MRPAPYATRRARDVNHGDRTALVGGESKTLAWISVEDAQPFTVYATARVQPAATAVLPVITVEWGHGGASFVSEMAVIKRLRLAVAGSMVKLSGRLIDAATKKPAPRQVTGEITAAIAPGNDSEPLRNTTWVHQSGAEGVLATGQQRLFTLDGFNAGAADRWLMAFDATQRPADGTPPALVRPAGVFPRTFRLRRFDTVGFSLGVCWAVSSTPLVLTFDPAASFRVDAEFLL